jgi:hypothetical protein
MAQQPRRHHLHTRRRENLTTHVHMPAYIHAYVRTYIQAYTAYIYARIQTYTSNDEPLSCFIKDVQVLDQTPDYLPNIEQFQYYLILYLAQFRF